MKQEEKNLLLKELCCRLPYGVKIKTSYDNIEEPIELKSVNPKGETFVTTKYGQYQDEVDSKCIIFPKGETTWENFPRLFKDGDVVTDDDGWIGITSGGEKNQFIPTYCVVKPNGEFEAYLDKKDRWAFYRLATEEEKERLFKVIKEKGYKWNAETKTLEKLIEPKFKVGDRIRYAGENVAIKIIDIKNNQYHIECLCDKYNEYKYGIIPVSEQKHYILIPKFDITTLKPFDKVLVRDFDNGIWDIEFFSRLLDGKHFKCLEVSYVQCIPYKGNEHLLGTTNDCSEFYKTWEE